eukprot:scaffold5552_cov93-Isochrysis_galbana.AAC.4
MLSCPRSPAFFEVGVPLYLLTLLPFHTSTQSRLLLRWVFLCTCSPSSLSTLPRSPAFFEVGGPWYLLTLLPFRTSTGRLRSRLGGRSLAPPTTCSRSPPSCCAGPETTPTLTLRSGHCSTRSAEWPLPRRARCAPSPLMPPALPAHVAPAPCRHHMAPEGRGVSSPATLSAAP